MAYESASPNEVRLVAYKPISPSEGHSGVAYESVQIKDAEVWPLNQPVLVKGAMVWPLGTGRSEKGMWSLCSTEGSLACGLLRLNKMGVVICDIVCTNHFPFHNANTILIEIKLLDKC